jgi:hypothetical protein
LTGKFCDDYNRAKDVNDESTSINEVDSYKELMAGLNELKREN